MYCRNCGSQQPNSAKICSNCGCELSLMEKPEGKEENQNMFSKGSIVFIVLACSFLAIIIGWAAFKNYEETGSFTVNGQSSSANTTSTISNSSNVSKPSVNSNSDTNEDNFMYRDTMAVLEIINRDHPEFEYSNVTEKGDFDYKISDITYSAYGMGHTSAISGKISGCQIDVYSNVDNRYQELLLQEGGADALNKKLIDEIMYLVYSPYLSTNEKAKDVIANKLFVAVKNKSYIYVNGEQHGKGTLFKYLDYIYEIFWYTDKITNNTKISFINIVPDDDNYVGPGLEKFNGDVLTDDEIDSYYSLYLQDSTTTEPQEEPPKDTTPDSNATLVTYDDFSMKINQTKWKDISDTVSGVNCAYSYIYDENDPNLLTANINVIAQKDTAGRNLSEYSDIIKETYAASGYRLEKYEETDFNGNNAYKIETTVTQSEITMKMNQIIFIKDNIIYIISYGSEKSVFNSVKLEFEKILNSFTT